jgi:hypothetical protein
VIKALLAKLPFWAYAIVALLVTTILATKLLVDKVAELRAAGLACQAEIAGIVAADTSASKQLQIEALQRGIIALQGEVAARDAVTKRLSDRARRAEREVETFRRQQQEARTNEPDYAEWADRPVPDSVRRRLCEAAGGEACGNAGGGVRARAAAGGTPDPD